VADIPPAEPDFGHGERALSPGERGGGRSRFSADRQSIQLREGSGRRRSGRCRRGRRSRSRGRRGRLPGAGGRRRGWNGIPGAVNRLNRRLGCQLIEGRRADTEEGRGLTGVERFEGQAWPAERFHGRTVLSQKVGRTHRGPGPPPETGWARGEARPSSGRVLRIVPHQTLERILQVAHSVTDFPGTGPAPPRRPPGTPASRGSRRVPRCSGVRTTGSPLSGRPPAN
jgi:hypothetical protein